MFTDGGLPTQALINLLLSLKPELGSENSSLVDIYYEIGRWGERGDVADYPISSFLKNKRFDSSAYEKLVKSASQHRESFEVLAMAFIRLRDAHGVHLKELTDVNYPEIVLETIYKNMENAISKKEWASS